MRKLIVVLLLFTAGILQKAAAQDTVSDNPQRPKVGVVLSGGGAKGVAHISVLKVLDEAGMPIDYIAGTSMGAIMGGLYSIGYTPHELDSMVRTQDWPVLLSDRVARDDKLFSEKESADTYIISVPMSLDRKLKIPSGVVAGQNVRNLLNEMTIGYQDNDVDFSTLPIPFTCVAYDMVKGEEYVFEHGNLTTAIRASMSIPGAFAPVLLDSMVLVDGGIYNNFPVDVVRKMGADIVIGVDLSAGIPEYEDINSIMGLIDQLTTFMGREKYSQNRKDVDLYINPPVKPYTSASFSAEAIDSLLMRGETEARKHWDEIVALKDRVCGTGPEAYAYKQPKVAQTDTLKIGTIHFEGMSVNEEALIRKNLGIEENCCITKTELNNAIGRLRGSGAFSYVTYMLESKPPHDLRISVNEKSEASVNLGFRFDTEEMASILLGSSFSFRGLMGPRLDATVRLNENPYVRLDAASSSWFLGRIGLSYMYKYNNYTFTERGKNDTRVKAHMNRVDFYFTNANPRRFSVNLGIQYEHFNYRSFLMTSGSEWDIVKPKGFINYYATGYFESFNNYYYPTKGYGINTNLMLYTDNAYQFEDELPFMSIQYNFRWALSANNRLTFIPSLYGRTIIGKNVHFAYRNGMGGELDGRYISQQLSFPGVRDVELLDNSVMVASLEARMRIFKRNYVSVKGAFATQNNNFFEMFSGEIKDKYVWGAAIKYSYDSPIGPISAQLDATNLQTGIGIYVSLGKNF